MLWTSRNQLRFEDKSFSEIEMLAKALKAAKEWQEAQTPRKQSSVSNKDCHISTSLPSVPDNVFKLFLDAAWNSSSLAGGFGWICTDAKGAQCFQGTETRRYVASALVAEALALWACLSKAASSNIKDVICLSDSKSLIDLITGNKSVVALRGLLHDIGVLSKSLTSISFCFISRACNGVADKLAKDSMFQYSSNLVEVVNNVVS